MRWVVTELQSVQRLNNCEADKAEHGSEMITWMNGS